jgi:hypothetical protein
MFELYCMTSITYVRLHEKLTLIVEIVPFFFNKHAYVYISILKQSSKDKQRSTKHTYKTKDRVTRTPLKTGGELRCS